jgi:bifunctional NMN adenylyltransferase/nudix hydrolase
VVIPIKDMPDDHNWSKGVDSQIEAAIGDMTVTLYGSRDSFIPHYFGRYPTIELQASLDLSGTQARESASNEIKAERGYRVGIIYAAFNRYPISYQCVDAIIWRRKDNHFLMGRKKTDTAGLFRFVGGFVQPEDESLDVAVRREAMEETGSIEFAAPRYLLSTRVEDWRYRKEKDKILTAVFALEYLWGDPTPNDDIDQLKWFEFSELEACHLVPEHREIWEKAKPHFP